jgi:GT2 family glycosyltransferase
VRRVRCAGRGIATGTNLGLRAATSGHVLVTHDDCTVAVDWIEAAARHAAATPSAIVTGRVLPGGDPRAVPSTKTEDAPFDFTGQPHYGVLYPANMLLPRVEVLAVGGFDERPSLQVAAEDNDLCYRWLTAGRPLRYEPELVVTHHDWRSPEALERLYVAYGRGQGAFYAKHLLAGDRRMLRFIVSDLARGLRSVASGVRHRRPRWTDERRGLPRGIPAGLLAGARDEWALRTERRRGPAGGR